MLRKILLKFKRWLYGSEDGMDDINRNIDGYKRYGKKQEVSNMVYKLTLGDWSKDGHGISKDFLFECNYDVHRIRQAYKDSCKKLGIAFNHGSDYAGLGCSYGSAKQIWTEYEDSIIRSTVFETLKKAHCLEGINYYPDDFRDGYHIGKHEDCAKLIMNFIAVSMPNDFIYQLIEPEPINGYWNDELNHQFGYGLFH